jgi:hypothetical protein
MHLIAAAAAASALKPHSSATLRRKMKNVGKVGEMEKQTEK